MAGNVKEWCLTAAGTERYIAGGAWDDPAYTFNGTEAQPPFARHATHGFRCVKVDRPDDLSAALTGRIDLPSRDLRKAKPVSDVVFEAWRRALYTFDHSDPHAKVEAMDDSSGEWRKKNVSYAAAYGDERISAYRYRARRHRRLDDDLHERGRVLTRVDAVVDPGHLSEAHHHQIGPRRSTMMFWQDDVGK